MKSWDEEVQSEAEPRRRSMAWRMTRACFYLQKRTVAVNIIISGACWYRRGRNGLRPASAAAARFRWDPSSSPSATYV